MEEMKTKADNLKTLGNDKFKNQQYNEAIE